MPLSDEEARLLHQLEQSLAAEDPDFASTLRGSAYAARNRRLAILGVVGLLAGIGVLFAGAVTQLTIVGVATGVTHGLVEDEPGRVGDLVGATLGTAPSALLLASVVVLLHGWVPRWTALAWLLVAWAGIQAYLGDLLDFPEWVRGLSPYRHLALPPAEELAWTPVLVQLALALVVTAVGLVGWLRRDVVVTSGERASPA